MTMPANIVRPLLFLALIGSLAWAIVQLIQSVVPDVVDSVLVVLCMVAALEGMYSDNLVKAQNLHSSDVTKFHAVELIGLLVLFKLSTSLGSLPTMLPRLLTFDLKTFLGAFLMLIFWVSALDTGRDMADLDAPPIPVERAGTYVSPAERLTQRFFVGGVLVLIITGLLNLRRGASAGLILNVLVYFVAGLLYLAHIRLAAARREWRSLGLVDSEKVASPWMRFAAILVGIAAVVSFVLPTQYMLGLLDSLWEVFHGIMSVITTIFALLTWLITLPLRLISGQPVGQPTDTTQPPPVPPPAGPPAAAGSALWSLLPKLLLLVIMAYIIISYLRDNPELMAMLQKLRIVAFLRELWASLWRRVGKFGTTFRLQLPQVLPNLRLRRGRATSERFGFVRLNALSPRERVQYFYLSTVRRAQEQGIARAPDQTPYEYQEVLGGELTDAQAEVDALTQAFVEARYSPDPVDTEKAKHTQTHWQQLRRALQRIKRQPKETK